MTRADFVNEMRRLYGGFSRQTGDLTQERLDALYERYGHVPLPAMRAAVSAMLCEARLPSVAAQDAIIDRALERYRQRNLEHDRERARGILFPDGTVRETFSVDPAWGQLCLDLLRAELAGQSPRELAALLEAAAANHRSQTGTIQAWLEELQAFGAEWPLHRERIYGVRDKKVVAIECIATMPDGRQIEVAP